MTDSHEYERGEQNVDKNEAESSVFVYSDTRKLKPSMRGKNKIKTASPTLDILYTNDYLDNSRASEIKKKKKRPRVC